MVINLGIGLYTPPIGTTPFISSSTAKSSLGATTKELWPFFAVAMILLIAVSYIYRPLLFTNAGRSTLLVDKGETTTDKDKSTTPLRRAILHVGAWQ